MLPVARALACAYEMGIVHCDLKPENILLADSGRVLVVDFGIARQVSLALAATVSVARAPSVGDDDLAQDGRSSGPCRTCRRSNGWESRSTPAATSGRAPPAAARRRRRGFGAGKSSFVRAGVIPALKRAGRDMESFVLRPGRHSVAALADVLAHCTDTGTDAREADPEAIAGTLWAQPGHLGARLRARCRKRGPSHRILLFVDQLEELYTLGTEPGEAAFSACLKGVADGASLARGAVGSKQGEHRRLDLRSAGPRAHQFLLPNGSSLRTSERTRLHLGVGAQVAKVGRRREASAHLMRRSPRHDAQRRRLDPSTFRSALLSVAPEERDAWVDLVLGLGELPDDGPDLPKGCVPYLPCSVDVVLRMVDQAPVRASDVFVDVGSGVGRAAALVHLLTGASVIGLEVQRGLVLASRDLAARLLLSRMSTVEGDATELTGLITTGSVFFLYCPFSGDRLARMLANLEPIARTRMLRICCVDLPLPARPWLTLETHRPGDLAIYRTTLHGRDAPTAPSDLR